MRKSIRNLAEKKEEVTASLANASEISLCNTYSCSSSELSDIFAARPTTEQLIVLLSVEEV